MVRTRSRLEHITNDKLIDERLSVEDISSKLANLMTRSDDFSRRFEILSSELAVKRTNHPARKKCSQQCTISSTRLVRGKPCPCIN